MQRMTQDQARRTTGGEVYDPPPTAPTPPVLGLPRTGFDVDVGQ